MKPLLKTCVLLALTVLLGSYIYFDERGPVAEQGSMVLLRFDPAQVREVRLKASGAPEVVLRRVGKSWTVSAGAASPAPADFSTVAGLLSTFQLIQSSEPVAGEASPARTGLDHPSSSIQFDDQLVSFGNRPGFNTALIYARCGEASALVPASLADVSSRNFASWLRKSR